MKIPAMSTRIQVPKIPGMDTSQYVDWDWRDGNKRKAFHIEVARPRVKQIQQLFDIAKRRNMIATFWGPGARVSSAIPTKTHRK